jgi:hypothetical protein
MYQSHSTFVVDIFIVLFAISAIALVTAGMWKCFEKAGHEGWKSIIPIYNFYIMCKIAKLPGWFFILLLIPIVNSITALYLYYQFARAFGKSTLFSVGNAILSPIMMLIIAYGDSQYIKDIPEVTKQT